MNLNSLRNVLAEKFTLVRETKVLEHPTLVGYDKKLRWFPLSVLHTNIVVTDFGEEEITLERFVEHLRETTDFIRKEKSGYTGLISILISSQVSKDYKRYCNDLKLPRKLKTFPNLQSPVSYANSEIFPEYVKASLFLVPAVIDTYSKEFTWFKKKPWVGRVHYSRFEKILNTLRTGVL